MRDLILAIDQGTTGTTVLLVDEQLQMLGQATAPFEQHYPQPGWVEHRGPEIWASVLDAIRQVFAQHPGTNARVAAIGLTNQRETCLIWDRRTHEPIAPAIVWQDRRTADACKARIKAGEQTNLQRQTGLCLDPYFSATKLHWLVNQGPKSPSELSSGNYAAGTIDTYLLWCLSGGQAHATEPSNASRTMLWNLRSKAGRDDWDPDLVEHFAIPRALLPEVLASDSCFGHTTGIPGLADGIPIHGILGDQQAALMGQMAFEPGQVKCTYGTGAFVLAQSGERFALSSNRLLTSVAWQIGDHSSYCLEGSAFLAGALVQWCKEGLGLIEQSQDIEALAASVETSDGVVLIPGHAGLGAPHWNPDAKGMIAGLSRGTRPGHIARAALEGIACSVHELLLAMQADLGVSLSSLRVDGGAAANNLLLQIQADLARLPIARPKQLESTGLGAAMIAGLGCGLWKNKDELAKTWQLDRSFELGDSQAKANADRIFARYRQFVTKA